MSEHASEDRDSLMARTLCPFCRWTIPGFDPHTRATYTCGVCGAKLYGPYVHPQKLEFDPPGEGRKDSAGVTISSLVDALLDQVEDLKGQRNILDKALTKAQAKMDAIRKAMESDIEGGDHG